MEQNLNLIDQKIVGYFHDVHVTVAPVGLSFARPVIIVAHRVHILCDMIHNDFSPPVAYIALPAPCKLASRDEAPGQHQCNLSTLFEDTISSTIASLSNVPHPPILSAPFIGWYY